MRTLRFTSLNCRLGRDPEAACWALCLALLLGLPSGAQNGSQQQRGTLQQQMSQQPLGGGDVSEGDLIRQEQQLRALNAERQKSMVSDAGKLLKLAHELDAEISSANPGTLNADQLRKLAEIEKLARSVKDKMTNPVRGNGSTTYSQPLTPQMR